MRRIISKTLIFILIINLNLSTFVSTEETLKNIIYVDDDGGADFTKIQDAINASKDFDIIFVYEGIYYENIIINKSVQLIGENKNITFIDGRKSDNVVYIKDDNVKISRFTIKNSSSNKTYRNSSGIFIESNYNIISGNEIINNNFGLVLYQNTENQIINNNFISCNKFGLNLEYSCCNNIFNNNFMNNKNHAIFFNSRLDYENKWVNNYWNEQRSIPKLILGYVGNIRIPWINVDWQPSNKLNNVIDNPIAQIDTSFGSMKLLLYQDKVPNTVENFINLVNSGFYDNLIFHRVIDDFVIQGGGYYPNGTYKESPFGPINLEIHPDVRHIDGAISMARTNNPNSATSQFFICDGAQSFLDDDYAAFGVILEGFEVLRNIANVDTITRNGMKDWPVEDIIIYDIITT